MNSKPHIFLDIDDVLATEKQYDGNPRKWHPYYNRYLYDVKCVKVFNDILDNVQDYVIILSSDWKDHYSLEQMNKIFEINGINGRITDYTDSSWGVIFKSLKQLEECRAYEINEYVKKHKITNWVAIDDLDLSPWIPDNFVRTPRPTEGIKQMGIKDKILNKFN